MYFSCQLLKMTDTKMKAYFGVGHLKQLMPKIDIFSDSYLRPLTPKNARW
jgi:hypothetical protein